MTLDRRLPILVSPPTLPLSRNFATSQYRSGDGGVSVGRAQGRSDDCCSQKNYKGGRARRQMNRSDDGPHTRQNEADTRAQSSPQGKGWAGKVMVRRGFPEPGPSES
ncbi:hypothetical protein MUK42_05894 [Musa troglodytarum]|uniref:Uncharacterized protein n=1 Tax=Musa troglodytarum TaxID=320322 RepID=A0A9E7KC44_9LILI|nr:hypothetical protein MUK42_05894 [Musa troglodytarum]